MKRILLSTWIVLLVVALLPLSARGTAFGVQAVQGDDLEAIYDAYVGTLLDERRLPGIVLIVVDAQQVLLAKGYGLANLEPQRLFDPDVTVLSAASVAKAFTALATLQLYEQGIISLDEDVNTYLRSFKLPDFQGKPITVRQLLTHTEGFEARITADAVPPGEPVPPLKEAAKQNMPRRILPPGEQLTYGSYASNLLGVLIEDLSGQPYEQYVEENILKPLGMARTTFRQPLPQALSADLASACVFDEQQQDFVTLPLIVLRMAPQGGLYTTAADMGRFLQMLLNRGELERVRIARPETIDLMFQPQFTDDPLLPGITFGLFEVVHRGQRLLMRDGDGLGTRSRLVLIPEAGIGLFVSYNSEDDEVREAVAEKLLEHLFPAPAQAAQKLDSPTPLSQLAGTYRPLQWDQTTPGKLTLLFANQIRVQPDPEQPELLRIESIGMGEALGGFEGVSLWREREPLLFEVVRRERTMLGETILFERNAAGRIAYLRSGSKYHGAFVKVPWYETPEVQWVWLIVCVVLMISTFIWISSLIIGILNLLRRRQVVWLAWLARLLGLIVSVLFPLSVLEAFGRLFFIDAIAGIPPLAFGINPQMAAALNQLWLPAILTLGLIGFNVLAWVKRYWNLAGRIHYTLVALAAVGLVFWLNHWNLLGYASP